MKEGSSKHCEYPALGYRSDKRTLVDDNDNWAENGADIYYSGGNLTNESENKEDNNSSQEESIEPNEENKGAGPLTGAVVGTNDQDNIITRLFEFIRGLFK